jgi:N-acetylmuramoyl-L-alanine amidase
LPGDDGKIVVVLDPGHGGIWTGATSRGYVEAEITLKIANYCKEYIEKTYPSIKVYMTRTENKTFSNDLPTDLKERIYFAKEKNADVLVSLHLNAFNGKSSGCLICTQHQPQVKDDAARLGTLILEQLEALGIKSRAMSNGVRKGLYIRYSSDFFDDQGNPKEYYQICRNAANENLVGIIVEHCFIDSEDDTKYFADEEAIRRLAIADAKGIAKYFGIE